MRILGFADRAKEILATSKEKYMIKQYSDCQNIARVLAKKTAREWEELLKALHIPAARVRRIDETLIEPQVALRFLRSYGTPLAPDAPEELPTATISYAYRGPKHSRPPPGFGSSSNSI